MPDDCDHEAIASSLCDLLSSGLEHITSAVFDALSNLCLSEQVKKTVHDLAVTHLTSASVQDIPVIVKYLLRSCESIEVSKRVSIVLWSLTSSPQMNLFGRDSLSEIFIFFFY